MRALTVSGSILFGLALLGFGAIQWATQNYLTSLLPITGLPLKPLWVNLTATVFILCGALLAVRQAVFLGAGMAVLLFALLFIYPHLFRLFANIRDPRVWTVAFETLALCSGACFMAARERKKNQKGLRTTAPLKSLAVASRLFFAACLVVFGIQHFMYQDFILTLMPAWLPGKIAWSYLVKFGFLLAALSLLFNRKADWGMLLLGVMYLSWVLILHAPRSFAAMANPDEWTSLCIALAMAGLSFYMAGNMKKNDNVVSPKLTDAEKDYVLTS